MVECSLCMREMAGPMPAFSNPESYMQKPGFFFQRSQLGTWSLCKILGIYSSSLTQSQQIFNNKHHIETGTVVNYASWHNFVVCQVNLWPQHCHTCTARMRETPEQGLEPWTLRLKVWCSTDWAIQALLKNQSNLIFQPHVHHKHAKQLTGFSYVWPFNMHSSPG